ncbi:MAG: CDP-diacylglycerol--glycerol-3-phosphate 3-phosphatidyltransferase [Pyrinomonadaceae bacterium]|nr:CDP-diacylglycerol--glycerol-3-phosphate 3-phosphatidyltransferase [Pyrinomonadaceae bacterium]
MPNYITLGRIVIVPLLVVVLLTPEMSHWFGISSYALAIVLFLIAALTDMVDGQLARRRNQVSTLGKFLDPIADKLLIASALIVLVEKASCTVVGCRGYSRGREFIITGFQEHATSEGVVIQAQSLGKIKMWAQCVAVVALLVAAANGDPPVSNFGLDYPAFFWRVAEVRTAFADLMSLNITTNDWKVFGYLVGRGALWVSVITALWSMYGYFAYFLREKKKHRSENSGAELEI